ncbi:MAG: hypothetical protein AB8C84_11500, partial [Oligoflexales bacterium]
WKLSFCFVANNFLCSGFFLQSLIFFEHFLLRFLDEPLWVTVLMNRFVYKAPKIRGFGISVSTGCTSVGAQRTNKVEPKV